MFSSTTYFHILHVYYMFNVGKTCLYNYCEVKCVKIILGTGSAYQQQHKCFDGDGKHKRKRLNVLIRKITFKLFKT